MSINLIRVLGWIDQDEESQAFAVKISRPVKLRLVAFRALPESNVTNGNYSMMNTMSQGQLKKKRQRQADKAISISIRVYYES